MIVPNKGTYSQPLEGPKEKSETDCFYVNAFWNLHCRSYTLGMGDNFDFQKMQQPPPTSYWAD